ASPFLIYYYADPEGPLPFPYFE
nr:zona pellucida-binding protein, AWN-1=T5 fragment [swine, sperm, Peptide Partial, 22 aa] [Sus scrofa]